MPLGEPYARGWISFREGFKCGGHSRIEIREDVCQLPGSKMASHVVTKNENRMTQER
jgi:hypothetical protein